MSSEAPPIETPATAPGEDGRAADVFRGVYVAKHVLESDENGRTQIADCPKTGRRVVIRSRFTKNVHDSVLMRMRYEASVLANLKSNHYNAPLEVITDADQVHFVYPFLRGTRLATRLRHRRLDAAGVLQLARDVLTGLRDLHQNRIFHRGVSPNRIVINPHEDVRKAVLVDFGDFAPNAETARGSERFKIEARYYAPELAGSIDHDITASTDLYSLGIVLFECLAGYPPFQGDDLNAVLFSHMTEDVPDLRSLGIAIPRVIDEVIQRLLRKDPRDRYQSADAALADLLAIQEAIRNGDDDPAVAIGSSDSRSTLAEPAFVSRAAELKQFNKQIEAALAGQSRLVRLEGESGSGKSRLLTEVSHRATRKGFRVFRGLASSNVAQRPLQILDGVVERFLTECQNDPAFAGKVVAKLGEDAKVVSAAIPELRELLGAPINTGSGPEMMGEMRTIRALAKWLSALGTKKSPALVILDDCQWADELTIKLLRDWHARSRAGKKTHVVVVAGFRSDEVAEDHVLRKIATDGHFQLALFEPDEVRQLAESMAGKLPEAALDLVIQLGGGSPFMSAAVLHGLVESGALFYEDHQWKLDPLAIGKIHSSDRETTFLTRRLELLSEDVIQLLTVGAVIGKEFDIQMASRLAEQAAESALSAIDETRQRQLLWVRPDGVTCVFMHDKIRRALLDRVSADELRTFHLRVAEYYQKHKPDRISELAYHFDAAGASDQAFSYALRAAEDARARHALETAEQQYQIARRGARRRAVDVQFRVAEGLGDVLMLRGKYDAAGELFSEAEQIAESNHTQAQIRGKLAELSFKRGDMEAAVRAHEEALRSLNRWIPQSKVVIFLWMLWEVAVQVLHTLCPQIFVQRRKKEPTASERLAFRLYSGLAHGCWYCRGSLSTLWAHLRGLNLAERYGPTPELGNAYSEHAPVMSLLGMFSRGLRYAQKSLTIRRELGDLWGQGQSLHYYGIVLYAASRYSECINRCRESIRLLERMGDYWQVHIARYQIAASYYRLGDLETALEESKKNHQSGIYLGDEQASGIILDVWARAAHGDVPQELLETEVQRDRFDAQGQAQVLFASAVCQMSQGQLPLACERMDQAIKVITDAGVCNSYTLPIRAWSATAYRRLAESLTDYTPGRRRKHLRKAIVAAYVARMACWRCHNDLPHIYRELGLLNSMLGRKRAARRFFQKSTDIARRHECRYEHAQTTLAMAKIGREFGWTVDESAVGDAEAVLAEIQAPRQLAMPAGNAESAVPTSLSLADRFDTVLQSGRKIAIGLSESAIHQETHAAACRLLRVHHAVILKMDSDTPPSEWRAVSGELSWEVNTGLMEQALAMKKAVSATTESSRQTNRQRSSHAISELCVPISMRGQLVFCLYVMHPEIRDLFGDDEERLADFLATIAGAALENAEGFAELQDLNVTLERRVAERTMVLETRSRELATSNKELERIAQELRQAQVQLSASKQAAESASEAKSRFLATMSHEIRTPMNGILGMADLVLGSSLEDRQRGYLETLKQSANALLTLLNDLLDFSKIEAGKMELEQIPFSLRDMVLDSARLLAIPAFRKGLDFITHIEPDVPSHVIGDPNRLRQVIVNLVGNSIKFTPDGEVRVHVAVQTRSAQESMLRISVIDTGIGIPQDKQASVFEAFHQTDSSVTRKFGGTGLGLAITSQLVGLMDGVIQIESEVGAGTAFHLDIPFTVAGATNPHRLRGSAVPKVALLSTHEHSSAATQDLLEFIGASVSSSVENQPESGIMIADFGQHAEGLLDTVTSRIFDGMHRPEEVICLIPAGHNDLSDECDALEIAQVLTKPVKPQDLVAAIESILHTRSEEQSPENPDQASAERRLRVLVADDSPVNREVATGLIEMCGHSAITVENGQLAIESICDGDFDLVFLDIEMPVKDGLAAAKEIRQLPEEKAAVPIYAMTAHAMAETEQNCRSAGMDGVITKPIAPERLMEILSRVAEPMACS